MQPADRERIRAPTPVDVVHSSHSHTPRRRAAATLDPTPSVHPATLTSRVGDPTARRVGDFCLGVPLLPSGEQNSSLEADLSDHEDAALAVRTYGIECQHPG